MQHTGAEPPAKRLRTGSPAREQSECTASSAEPWTFALPEAAPEALAVIDSAVAEEQRVSASFADFQILVTRLPVELWLVIFGIMAAWPTIALKVFLLPPDCAALWCSSIFLFPARRFLCTRLSDARLGGWPCSRADTLLSAHASGSLHCHWRYIQQVLHIRRDLPVSRV